MNDAFHPHVTVATVVSRDGRYLLVEEWVRDQAVFNQPAGHLDPGETLIEAAVRETREETGYRVAVEALVGVYQWTSDEGEHYLRTAFAARCLGHERNADLDDGIIGVHWLSRDAVAGMNGRLRNDTVLRLIDDYEAGRRYSLDVVNWIDP